MLSTLTVPAGVVLRGERSSNTTLTIEHIGNGITVSRGQSGVFQPVVSGYTIHSASLVVTNGAVFAAGDYAEIREDNDDAVRLGAVAKEGIQRPVGAVRGDG
jgi:hypothetical protein